MVKKIIPETIWVKTKTGKERKAILQPPVKIQIRTGEGSDQSDVKAMMEWLRSLKLGEESVTDYVDKMEIIAKNRLKNEGFDPDIEMSYLLPNGGAGCLGGVINLKPCTPAWYAFNMLTEVRILRERIQERNFFEAISSAIQLAQAKGLLDLATFQPETLLGLEKVVDGMKSAKFSKEEKESWVKQARELLLQNRNWKRSDAARKIQKNNGLDEKSYQTVYKHLLSKLEKM